MNLQPLYDIKERLEHAAIAGTGLLEEDFRLKRAQEALAPLAAASPVFAKISASVQGLLEAPAKKRGQVLLDALALVDAVVYTQGSTGITGEIKPLPTGVGKYCPVSYGQLHPLIEALTSTGGGRMGIINDTWKNHPEYFEDYRILPLLVQGLGDKYNELADLIVSILTSIGEITLPLLKQNFDPAGKREMGRRIQVIEKIASAEENEFYLAQLPNAKKDIKINLIYALRHEPKNGARLVELCQTEKKEASEVAHFVLARFDIPEAKEYFETLARKKPVVTAHYLTASNTKFANELTAKLFLDMLSVLHKNPNIALDQTLWEQINTLRLALDGKIEDDIFEVYRQAASLGTALDRPMNTSGNNKKEIMGFWSINIRASFSQIMPMTLSNTLKHHPISALCDLAWELCEQYGGWWTLPALTATLLTKDADTAIRQGEKLLKKPLDFNKSQKIQILQMLMFELVPKNGCETYSIHINDPMQMIVNDYPETKYRSLAAPLAYGWFDLLIDENLDEQLIRLVRPKDAVLCDKLGKYFYKRAIRSGYASSMSHIFRKYLFALCDCGWTDWKDFLFKHMQHKGEISYYNIIESLQIIPIPPREKASQLKKIDQLVRGHNVKVYRNFWPEEKLKDQIEIWKNTIEEGGN